MSNKDNTLELKSKEECPHYKKGDEPVYGWLACQDCAEVAEESRREELETDGCTGCGFPLDDDGVDGLCDSCSDAFDEAMEG